MLDARLRSVHAFPRGALLPQASEALASSRSGGFRGPPMRVQHSGKVFTDVHHSLVKKIFGNVCCSAGGQPAAVLGERAEAPQERLESADATADAGWQIVGKGS